MIGKPQNPDVLLRTTRADFFGGYEYQEAFWPLMCMEIESDSPSEVMAFFGAIDEPKMTSPTAGAVGTAAGAKTGMGFLEQTDVNDYSVTLVNGTMTAMVPFRRETWEDQKLDQLSIRAKTLGEKAKAAEDRYFTAIVESNPTSYDGTNAFFAGTHEGTTAAAKDNDETYDSTPNPPNVSVSDFHQIFTNAIARMRVLTDDKNSPVNVGQLKLVCMVDPANEQAARAVLEVGPVAGQTGNSGVWKNAAKVVVNPFMTTSAGANVYLFSTGSAIKPFIFQKRTDWEFKLVMSGDDWDKKDTGFMKARRRLQIGGAAWNRAVRFVVS